MTQTKTKKPWLAALLNVVLPGTGYVYLGVRKVFASIMILSILMSIANAIFFSAKHSSSTVGQIVGLLILTAFAYDGYMEATKLNAAMK